MANWKMYKNGNYTVSIDLDAGTKIRENDLGSLTPAFSENCDMKITDRCDGGCEFCYEGCTATGKHAELLNVPFLDTLHPYTELAINGNDLTHPQLVDFLELMHKKHIIVNMTVNQLHFERHYDFVRMLIDKKLIYGLGVSLRDPNSKFIELVKQHKNIVIHTINGITTLDAYRKLANKGLKVLILGYKELQRGHDYYSSNISVINDMQDALKSNLADIINKHWFDVISFDNLAIEQLNVRQLLPDNEWDEFYMGDDAEYTFYIDMVEKKFAKNSIAPNSERFDITDSIDDMFNSIRYNVHNLVQS